MTPEAPSAAPLRIATLLLALSGAAMALRCVPVWSGDAALHLVLMESSAAGHWFVFNPGAPEPLSSSLLWTALGALLWKLGGVTSAVIGLKLANLAAWVAVALLAARIARALGATKDAAILAAVLAAALPGTVENSLGGMENGLFAALVLALGAWSVTPLGHGDFTWRRLWPLGPLAGLTLLARPEGALVVGLLALGLLTAAWSSPTRWSALGRLTLLLGAALVLAGPGLWLQAKATGQWLPQSALSRTMRARRDVLAFSLGGLWLHLRPALRLAAYAPLVFLGVRGARAPERRAGRVLLALAGGGALLYAFVGAVHTARYLLWIFALLGVLAAVGLSARPAPGRLALIALGWLVVVYLGEIVARRATPTIPPSAAQGIRSIPTRETRTTELLAALCAHGCCGTPGPPLELATIEIQSRLSLDDRVNVYSTEGLTRGPTGQPPRFTSAGCPDLAELAADPRLLAWLDDPSEVTEGCPLPPEVSVVQAAWQGHESPGWIYDPIGAVVRVCPAATP